MDKKENTDKTNVSVVYTDDSRMEFKNVKGYTVRDSLILVTENSGDNHIIPLVNVFAVTISIKE